MAVDAVSIVRVRDVLLVSMPSEPSDSTVAKLQEQLLGVIERAPARAVIIDAQHVDVLDSYFARALTETAQMVKLMGTDTVVAGIQPAVAMTAIELGLNLSALRAALDVDRAFDMIDQPEHE